MGKAKKLEVITTDLEGNSVTSEIFLYDDNGNTIDHTEFDPEGNIQNRVESKYDAENRLLEEIVYADMGEFSEHKKYHRKEDGSMEKTEIDYQDGSKAIQYLKKDEDQNTEEWIEEDEDGELESRELVLYDDKGKMAGREVYDYHNKLAEAFEFSYNEDGDLIERRQLDKKKKLLLISEYEYDENKNMIYRANRNRKGVLSDFIRMEYDTKGQVMRQDISGKYSFVFEYDDEGRTVLEERYLAGGQMEYQSRFEYDEEGRMVKEVNLEFTKEFKYEFF